MGELILSGPSNESYSPYVTNGTGNATQIFCNGLKIGGYNYVMGSFTYTPATLGAYTDTLVFGFYNTSGLYLGPISASPFDGLSILPIGISIGWYNISGYTAEIKIDSTGLVNDFNFSFTCIVTSL